MIDKILRLGKDAAIYGLSSIVGRFLNFLLVPFYTNYLLPSEYGVIANLYAYIAFAAVVYGCGMESAYMRFVASLEIGDKKQNFSTPFASLFVTSLLLSLLIHAFSGDLAELIGVEPAQQILVRYAGWILFFDTMLIIPYASLRMGQQAKTFAAFRVLSILINVLLNIVLIVGLGMKADGVLIANLLASAVTFLFLLYRTRPQITLQFSMPLYRELLKFGLPYVPAGLSGIAIQVIDRPILKALTNDATVGVYQANYRLGILMMLVVGMFDYAWRPFFLIHAKDEDAKELFSKVFTYFLTAMLFVFLAVSIFIDDLVRVRIFGGYFFHPDYWGGVSIVPWILFAYIFTGAYVNFVVGIYLEKKSSYLPYVSGAGALVNVGANLLLIPSYGMLGAAYATVLSYVVMAVGIYFASQRFYYVRYEWGKIFRISASTVGLLALYVLLDLEPVTVHGIIAKSALCVSFLILLITLKVFDRKELSATKEAFVRKFSGSVK